MTPFNSELLRLCAAILAGAQVYHQHTWRGRGGRRWYATPTRANKARVDLEVLFLATFLDFLGFFFSSFSWEGGGGVKGELEPQWRAEGCWNFCCLYFIPVELFCAS